MVAASDSAMTPADADAPEPTGAFHDGDQKFQLEFLITETRFIITDVTGALSAFPHAGG